MISSDGIVIRIRANDIRVMGRYATGVHVIVITSYSIHYTKLYDLELSKGSPENRRSFIDLCISQIKLGYKDVV